MTGAHVDFEGKDAAGSTVDVKGAVSPVAADPPFVILAPAAVARLDCVSLAQAASATPARAPRVVSRAAVGLFDILLEDACLLLAVVICVREPSQTLLRGVDRECEGKDAASRSLRRRYHHLYLSLCGLDNNGSVRDT